jgi:hypothetical protein
MDSESSSHYRGRKRKTGGRGRQKAEEAEAVPFQAELSDASSLVYVVATSEASERPKSRRGSPRSSP